MIPNLTYHIKEDADPVFPLIDGSKIHVSKFCAEISILPIESRQFYIDLYLESFKVAIIRQIREMLNYAPNAQHCLLVGCRLEEFEKPDPRRRLILGVALTAQPPDPLYCKTTTTLDVNVAVNKLLDNIRKKQPKGEIENAS